MDKSRARIVPKRGDIFLIVGCLLAALVCCGLWLGLRKQGGAVIVEQMFSWPGLGQVTWDAVLSRNYPVIMGVCLLSAVVVLASNLLTDVIYALVDPTIKY